MQDFYNAILPALGAPEWHGHNVNALVESIVQGEINELEPPFRLDASSWTQSHDFYAAILPALGAPEWHGENVNALVDSMIWGEINAVEPPFKVEVTATKISRPTSPKSFSGRPRTSRRQNSLTRRDTDERSR